MQIGDPLAVLWRELTHTGQTKQGVSREHNVKLGEPGDCDDSERH